MLHDVQLPVSCYLLAFKGEKGLSAPVIKNKLALRVSATGSIFLDGVKVKHDAILSSGTGSAGLGAPFSCLNSARYGRVDARRSLL